jgi:hypothetical protein
MARLLGPALHEILTLEGRPLPDDPLDDCYSAVAAREAFRRAALIFLAGVKVRCNAGAWELPKHLEAFRQISRLPLVDWSAVPELNLWAHVIAAIHEDSAERSWHIATISRIMEVLGIQTGAQALDVAKGVIWVDAIMSEKATILCQDIDQYLIANGLSLQPDDFPPESLLNSTASEAFLSFDV